MYPRVVVVIMQCNFPRLGGEESSHVLVRHNRQEEILPTVEHGSQIGRTYVGSRGNAAFCFGLDLVFRQLKLLTLDRPCQRLLVSTSRPCRMCEAAAGWAGISRMVYGDALIDAGALR